MKSKQIKEKEIISLEKVCWDFYKSCVCFYQENFYTTVQDAK